MCNSGWFGRVAYARRLDIFHESLVAALDDRPLFPSATSVSGHHISHDYYWTVEKDGTKLGSSGLVYVEEDRAVQIMATMFPKTQPGCLLRRLVWQQR
jgi:hypothetical protein